MLAEALAVCCTKGGVLLRVAVHAADGARQRFDLG
jgi:hypothetical protein